MPAIEIRPAVVNDLPFLSAIEHSFETLYTWQMDRNIDEAQVMINFREIRLPRPVRVEYPRPLDFLGSDGSTMEWRQYPNAPATGVPNPRLIFRTG